MITPEEKSAQDQENVDQKTQQQKDRNTNDEHMRIDEEGNEVGPEDEV